LVENDLVDCIVNLPTKLFLNTQIPACLWFLRRNKTQRKGEILFIDARNHGCLINRKNRNLSDEDITQIAGIYHSWRTGESEYNDVAGFCKSASLEEVIALNCALTPGRYIGLPDDEDDFNFQDQFEALKLELDNQIKMEDSLNKAILTNLSKIVL
jgi:type I restriction enzyme M protein